MVSFFQPLLQNTPSIAEILVATRVSSSIIYYGESMFRSYFILYFLPLTEQNRTEQNRTEQNRTEQNINTELTRYSFFHIMTITTDEVPLQDPSSSMPQDAIHIIAKHV